MRARPLFTEGQRAQGRSRGEIADQVRRLRARGSGDGDGGRGVHQIDHRCRSARTRQRGEHLDEFHRTGALTPGLDRQNQAQQTTSPQRVHRLGGKNTFAVHSGCVRPCHFDYV